jgi:hypothetical protein
MNTTPSTATTKRWRNFFVFGFLAITLLVYSMVVTETITHQLKNDFFLFHHAAYNFWQDQSVYKPIAAEIEHAASLQKILHQNPNTAVHSANLTPPTFILLTLPLGLLKESVALIIWTIISLAINCCNVFLLYRIFFKAYCKPIIYWALLGIYCASIPAIASVNLGQLSPYLLLSILWIWQWSKKDHDIKTGLLLGLLLSIKYFFGLFALFFLMQKRIRLIAAAIASFALMNSLAYLVIGKSAFVQYQQNLSHIYWYINNWNASLFGFLSRFDAHITNLYFIPARWVSVTYYCGCAALLFIQIQLCRKPLGRAYDFDFAFCYVLIASILMSPLGWLYYLVIMIIPILFIVQNCVVYGQNHSYKLLIIFLGMMLLFNLPVMMQDSIHIGWHNLSLFIANSFYSLLILLGLLFYCRHLTRVQYFATNKSLEAGAAGLSLDDYIPWAIIGFLSSGFSLLFMLFTILRGGLN